MRLLLEIVLLWLGFLLGLWYASQLFLPLFYGVPKAAIGWVRRQLSAKAILAYLVAPVSWTLIFCLLFFGLAFAWNRGFEYLRTSGGFNFGQALGTIVLVGNAIFNRKTRADMKGEFDEFVPRYRK